MKKPRERRREKIITAEERQRIVAAVKDEAFTRFLYALGQTGARPGEIRTVTAAHVKSSANAETLYWELEGKSTDRTGDSRCIYLTPGMAELCRDLAREYPEGPLFRNTRGKPWTRNAIRIRFRNLRKKLGLPRASSPTPSATPSSPTRWRRVCRSRRWRNSPATRIRA